MQDSAQQSVFHQRWQAANTSCEAELADGSLVVNGVVLSPNVLCELRKLGFSLSSYNEGELETAVLGCAFDETLVDDPDGNGFFDLTKLTDNEELQEHDCEAPRNPFHLHPHSFCQHVHEQKFHDDEQLSFSA